MLRIDNKREYYRLKFTDKIILFRLMVGNRVSSWGQCNLIDLSGGGAKISTTLDFPVGFSTEVVFELERKYYLRGLIKWKNHLNNKFNYGLQWKNIKREEHKQLIQGIFNLQKLNRKV